ncbi:lipopolysaccharide biosynthesis protein [Hyphobacterium sp. HN65]|uniref:Lipopolysaccharide biosynthesis protein n=1 Tax=Hyphobacterium lacteum TaxID=3116575 RepID=A0ABU7LME7_9PROT|nr:lipopolysaccharide biosynthesis protein [Hyphobacterium sp. HN65]MEE2525100.1 lipopolysaccharide biosynthesis protein [Hyphobacterium sp. HN65]
MLGKHILGYLPVQIARALVGFGGVAVLTRLMPAEMYGQYALALTAMHITAMAFHTWLDAAVARFHERASERGQLAAHLATIYTTFAWVSAGLILLGALGLWVAPLSIEMKTALAFALGSLILRSMLMIGLETRRAAGEVTAYSVYETFSTLAGFALGIGILLVTPLGAAGPIAGLALASLITLFFEFPAQARKTRGGKLRKRRIAVYFAYGLPVSISLVFEHLLSAGDRFLIAGLMNEAAVGIYSAGYGLADRTIDILFIWLGAAATPLMIRALERDGEDAAREVAGQSARVMGLLGFPAAAGLALVAAPLTSVMVGEEFRAGATLILPWIALAGLMKGLMTYYFHEAFILRRKTRWMAAIMAAAAIFNIGLNIALIPHFGIAGAAAATLAAYAASLVACAVIGRNLFPLPLPWLDWGKAAMATLGMAAIVMSLPLSGPAFVVLMAKAIAGGLTYVAIALALNIAGCRSWLGVAQNWLRPSEAVS